MNHTWAATILSPKKISSECEGCAVCKPKSPKPPKKCKREVRWFPHCSKCGTQTTGAVHRASARHEWSATMPPCIDEVKENKFQQRK